MTKTPMATIPNLLQQLSSIVSIPALIVSCYALRLARIAHETSILAYRPEVRLSSTKDGLPFAPERKQLTIANIGNSPAFSIAINLSTINPEHAVLVGQSAKIDSLGPGEPQIATDLCIGSIAHTIFEDIEEKIWGLDAISEFSLLVSYKDSSGKAWKARHKGQKGIINFVSVACEENNP